jgi:hypothetical protein
MKLTTRPPTCTKPDRDVPKVVCGYPIPCPYHTVVIDPAAGEIVVPIRSGAIGQEKRLVEIAEAVPSGKRLSEKENARLAEVCRILDRFENRHSRY